MLPLNWRRRKKKESLKPVKKKKKHEEVKPRKKIELKCFSLDKLFDNLKAFKSTLHNNNKMDAHLMAHKIKEVASAATPSRGRRTVNSNHGRESDFPNEWYETLAHYERGKVLEGRGIIHERMIRFEEEEPDFMYDRISELGWGFMYKAFRPINLTIVREFYSNLSSFN
ncbi:hypothetical protein PIB30_043617 [Stylosanthes scabra]|uniref:Uncharacterized protein n=1 Tax=Stylosanthes scabra TaxID=79078 RepID=A0ABU6VIF9_9FABA|nr:hypothetical protein [Stylosanthes scabra]